MEGTERGGGVEGLGVLLVLGLRQSVVLLRWNQGRVR